MRNRLTRGDPELFGHDVHAGYPFGHRVFDLQPGIHFHEIHRIGVQIVDELDGTGADIGHLIRERRGVGKDRFAQSIRQHGGIGFFEDLLLVPLHAAVAQTEHPGIALRVTQQLYLDVTQ